MEPFLGWVRGRATDTDDAMREALDRMAQEGLLGARIPRDYGGLGWDDAAYRAFEESLARISDALAIVQSQHQSACAIIARSPKAELRQHWLPRLARGEARATVAFTHLREPGAPMLLAVPTPGERWYETTGDYTLMGTSPSVIGWDLFDTCVTAATRTDAKTIVFVHPTDIKEIEASPLQRLAVALCYREVKLGAQDVVLEADELTLCVPSASADASPSAS